MNDKIKIVEKVIFDFEQSGRASKTALARIIVGTLDRYEEQVKNSVVLADVSKQRGLLIAYELRWWKEPTQKQIEIAERFADMYLSNL